MGIVFWSYYGPYIGSMSLGFPEILSVVRVAFWNTSVKDSRQHFRVHSETWRPQSC